MIHGPEIDQLREAAKAAVMRGLVAQAEAADGVPATLRAMYVLKTTEARAVLAGQSSSMIEGEAALRGVSPVALAQVIVGMARSSEDLELQRMRLNVAIDAAEDEGAVCAVCASAGIALSVEV